MTDIRHIAPARLHLHLSQRLFLPKPPLGVSFAAFAKLFGDALNMAYIDPYTGLHRPRTVPEDDLDGRDPRW